MTRYDGVFPARMDAFPRVAALVDEAGAAAGFGRDDAMRLRLVIEELFTNTVVHGHGADSEAPVRLTLDSQPGRVGVTYEDTGPPFDPRGREEAVDPAALRPGGLGLVMVNRLGRELTYARVEDRNRLALVIEGTSGS
jgi:anti-sigma regulatory factor (Ser/Thr protein kinase)